MKIFSLAFSGRRYYYQILRKSGPYFLACTQTIYKLCNIPIFSSYFLHNQMLFSSLVVSDHGQWMPGLNDL